jgi:hypothetical protein
LGAFAWALPSPKSHDQVVSAPLPCVELSVNVTGWPGQEGIKLVVKLAIGLLKTVMVAVATFEVPPVVAVNVTVNVPGIEKMAPGLVAVEVLPFPKFQA